MEQSPAPRHFTRALRRRRSELFAVFGDLKELSALSNFEIIMSCLPDAGFEAKACTGERDDRELLYIQGGSNGR
jgi:hypothetical protein